MYTGYTISIWSRFRLTSSWMSLFCLHLNLLLISISIFCMYLVSIPGWQKISSKWHCGSCVELQSRLKKAIEREFVDPYGNPLKRRFGLSAFKQGFESAYNNDPESSCPYFDHRTVNGSVTFPRAYLKKWFAGREAYFDLTC